MLESGGDGDTIELLKIGTAVEDSEGGVAEGGGAVVSTAMDTTGASSAVDGAGTDPASLGLTERDVTTDTSSSEGREKDLNREPDKQAVSPSASVSRDLV